MKNNNRGGEGEEGRLNKEGRLINILPLKRGNLSEGGGLFERGNDFKAAVSRFQITRTRSNKVK